MAMAGRFPGGRPLRRRREMVLMPSSSNVRQVRMRVLSPAYHEIRGQTWGHGFVLVCENDVMLIL
jgi:hypothetical protein